MSDSQRKVSPPKLLLISKHPTGKELDQNDKMLPEEIPELVNTDKVKKLCTMKKLQDYPHVSWCTLMNF